MPVLPNFASYLRERSVHGGRYPRNTKLNKLYQLTPLKELANLPYKALVYQLALSEEDTTRFFHYPLLSDKISLYDRLSILILHPNLKNRLINTVEYKNFIALLKTSLACFEPHAREINNFLRTSHDDYDSLNFYQLYFKLKMQLASINSANEPHQSVQEKIATIESTLSRMRPSISRIKLRTPRFYNFVQTTTYGNIKQLRLTLVNSHHFPLCCIYDSSIAKRIFYDERLKESISRDEWNEISFVHSNIAKIFIDAPDMKMIINLKRRAQYAAPHPHLAEELFNEYVNAFHSLNKSNLFSCFQSKTYVECMFILGLQQPRIAKIILQTPEYYDLLTDNNKRELNTVIKFVDIMKVICDEALNADLKRKRLDEPETSSTNELEAKRVRLG